MADDTHDSRDLQDSRDVILDQWGVDVTEDFYAWLEEWLASGAPGD